MTIYLCLVLTVLLGLLTTAIQSATNAGSRLQMASAVDLGLYSLFGQYDKTLLEQYQLLFLDGGYRQGQLQLGKVYQTLEEDISYNLIPGQSSSGKGGLWSASLSGGNITGYTLATDDSGNVFKGQVIDYMEKTLGAQGIQLLLKQLNREQDTVERLQENQERQGSNEAIEEYEQLKQEALEEREKSENDEIQQSGNEEETVVEEVPVEPGFVNPIEVIKAMKNRGILALVIPESETISSRQVDLSDCVSKRSLQQGMGVISYNSKVDSATGNLLFQEYLMKRCGSYTNPATGQLLEYPLEYILQGKASDIENLKEVVTQLLLIRETANILHLLTDSTKQAQLNSTALAIATAIGLPQAQMIVEGILLVCWAFGESVLDVRALLSGKKAALLKDNSSWQLSLENLANLPQMLSDSPEGSENGLDYNGYLRILLALKNGTDKVMRGMDMIEIGVNSKSSGQGFRMDSCIASLEVELEVTSGNRSFELLRSYGYDM